MRKITTTGALITSICMTAITSEVMADESVEQRVEALLSQMTIEEKIGQMRQKNAGWGDPLDYLGESLRAAW